MKDKILAALNNPSELEQLYRSNKKLFTSEFEALYPEIVDVPGMAFWYERLNYQKNRTSPNTSKDIIFVAFLGLLAGFIAKIPDIFGIQPELFYTRNISFIVYPILAWYFSSVKKIPFKVAVLITATGYISAVFINLLPVNNSSDTFILAVIHLPLFLWSMLGIAFSGGKYNDLSVRTGYLKYSGDLTVISAIILPAGALLTGLTVALFLAAGLDISELYLRIVVVMGLAAIPVVGSYLVNTNPELVGKVSPVIANIFTPIASITLFIYLIVSVPFGKSPYHDRGYLIIFNFLLIAVVALIFFSLTEHRFSDSGKKRIKSLLILSSQALLVNGIALSAIVFRISEYGFTPNRTVVLGSNILILTNVFFITLRLFRCRKGSGNTEQVAESIAFFLPIYTVWAAFVTFVVPFIFSFQ